MNIAIFFINKEYTNDECEPISLEEHLYNVDMYGSSPDLFDSFDDLDKAREEAQRLCENGNPCVIVDLDDDPTIVIELFE